jgi:hypothetical protein
MLTHVNRIAFAAMGIFGLGVIALGASLTELGLGVALIAVAIRLYPRYTPHYRVGR